MARAAWFLLSTAEKPASSISAAEIAAVLAFHFLVGGFTQEVLFRGFVINVLERHWGRPLGRAWWSIAPAGILATVLFMLAHVKMSPPYVNVGQQAAAFGLGIFYAVVRTRSLLGPSLCHNYSNGAYVALTLLKYS